MMLISTESLVSLLVSSVTCMPFQNAVRACWQAPKPCWQGQQGQNSCQQDPTLYTRWNLTDTRHSPVYKIHFPVDRTTPLLTWLAMSTRKHHVNRTLPCQQQSTMSTGEYHVDRSLFLSTWCFCLFTWSRRVDKPHPVNRIKWHVHMTMPVYMH